MAAPRYITPPGVAEDAGIGGLQTVEQEQATVNAAVARIVELGFRPAIFDYQAILRHGMTARNFCDFIKPVTSVNTTEELAELLSLGGARFWSLPVVATLDGFINFVNYLKSAEGRNAMTMAAKKRKLESKAVAGLSAVDVALLQMGNTLQSDYQQERKRMRFPIEEEQAMLRRQLKLLDEQLMEKENEARTRFGCIAEYVGPTVHQVKSGAFNMYLADCQAKGLRALSEFQGGFEKAVELFGNRVREQHFAAYLSDPDRSAFVRDYYNQKVVYLEAQGEKKQADTFRTLVALGCGENALTAPPVTTFVFDAPDSGGESERSTHSEQQHAPGKAPSKRGRFRKTYVRGHHQTRSKEKGGASGHANQQGNEQPPVNNPTTLAAGDTQVDPNVNLQV